MAGRKRAGRAEWSANGSRESLGISEASGTNDPAPDNGLLNGLPDYLRRHLVGMCERVSVKAHEVIVEPDEPVNHVWFPTTVVFSSVAIMPDGRAVEVGTAGPEGMVGIPVVLGVESIPRQVFAQIAGEAFRMDRPAFRGALREFPELNARMLRYVQADINDISLSVACNRLHSLDQRCARWILKTHDRVRGDYMPLTQQFLAMMLGVRRAGVSVAAEALQRAGLIRYQRGRITVLDRQGLEEASCPCYGINRESFRRTMGVTGAIGTVAASSANGTKAH